MPDAINFDALPSNVRYNVNVLRRQGHRAVYVRQSGRGWAVGTDDLPGWALVLG